MTKKEVVQILALLSSAFPNTRIDPDTTASLWYSLYCNEDFETAKKATELCIRTGDYFPNHKQFAKALFSCRQVEERIALPKYSDETVEKMLRDIDEMWLNDN